MTIKTAEDFEMVTFRVEQIRLSGEVVKALLTKLRDEGSITNEEYIGCFKEIGFEQMKVNRKDKKLAKPFKMPDLSNATVIGLVDMLGATREDIKLGKKLEGVYKIAIMARLVEAGEAAPSDAPEEEDEE